MTSYTKIDVAEAHIRTAVRLFFEDQHPIPIHALACAAREIISTLGEKMMVDTVLHGYAKATGKARRDVFAQIHKYASFLKHANTDADATLVEFSDTDNDLVLFVACHDFGIVTGGMPIEAQVYEAWWYSTHVRKVSEGPLKRQRLIKNCIRLFPNVRSANRPDQKRIGLDVLNKSLKDESLIMPIRRVVELPKATKSVNPAR